MALDLLEQLRDDRVTRYFKSLLPFTMPRFRRHAWVNDDAKHLWEPRMNRIASCAVAVDVAIVKEKLQKCGIVSITASELHTFIRTTITGGLAAMPVAADDLPYCTLASAHSLSRDFSTVVVGDVAHLAALQDALSAKDVEATGYLLGIPVCCWRLSRRICVAHNIIDPIWPMTAHSTVPSTKDNECTPKWEWRTNPILACFGVGICSHVPCSERCAETLLQAARRVEIWKALGYGSECDWLQQQLEWPAHWSAMHGIAEVKTPIMKCVMNTDATAVKFSVSYEGAQYPLVGGRGATFPFR